MDSKIQKVDEMPDDMKAIMTELSQKKGYDKNAYLNTLDEVKRLEMELYLDKQILELDHAIKLGQKQMKLCTRKEEFVEVLR